MRKLNNKGMTLVELIAGFLMVTIAATYFYSTLDVVINLYRDSTNETDAFVEKNYAIRMAEEYITTKKSGICTLEDITNYTKGYKISDCGSSLGYPKTYSYSGINYTIYNVTLKDNTSECNSDNSKCRKDIKFLYTKETIIP